MQSCDSLEGSVLFKCIAVSNVTTEMLFCMYISVQITEANFFTVCYGEWPWEEIHLTSDHLGLVQTWIRGLDALIEASRYDSQTKHNAHGSVHLLQCCYLKLFRKHGDRLSPTHALQEFAPVKQWKAKQVMYLLQYIVQIELNVCSVL